MVFGIVYVFLGFVVVIGCVQLSLLIMGASLGHRQLSAVNYLADFAERWLKGVCMYQDDTCEIISQSDHSFNSYDQNSKSSIYVYHWMRLIRFL